MLLILRKGHLQPGSIGVSRAQEVISILRRLYLLAQRLFYPAIRGPGNLMDRKLRFYLNVLL
jgi:hypothetical protein